MRLPFLLALLLAAVGTGLDAATATFELSETIPMPEVKGRIDHFAIDRKRHRLFVAALGNDTVEVIDLAQHKPLKRIAGLHEPQGVAYVPGLDRLVVANGDDASVDVYKGEDCTKISSLKVRDDPDYLRVDAKGQLVYLGHGSGHEGAIGIIDAGEAKLIADIVVDGHPEAFAVEAAGARIFVNVPDHHAVVVVDRSHRTVVATWELPAKSNFPMALDEEHARLFVGCRRPASIVILDTKTGDVVQRVEAPGDLDDVWFDATSSSVYVTGGEGAIAVLSAGADGRWSVSDKIETSGGARTSFFDEAERRLYVAVPSGWTHDAELRGYRLSGVAAHP